MLAVLIGASPAIGQGTHELAVLQHRIEFLASQRLAGRASGTAGNDRAAAFIAQCFRRAGLKALGTDHQHDATASMDGTGYFQPFTFVAGSAPGRRNSLEAKIGGVAERLRAGVDFEPASISASRAAEGDVLFAGYGIRSADPQWDDYRDAQVQGKVVLLLAGSPARDPHDPLYGYGSVQRKAAVARDLGAAAVLVVSSSDSDVPHFQNDAVPSDEGIPVLLLRRTAARRWMKAGGLDLDREEDQARSKPHSIPLPVHVRLRTDVRKVRRVTANIAGLLPGRDPVLSAEVVVIGAHMDHLGMGGPYSLAESRKPAVHPGADDNASGTAGVLALADRFAKAQVRPKRSILFVCFSGEELGLLGSSYYVRHPLIPLDHTIAMINMDMIGRLREKRLIVLGSGTSPQWDGLLSGVDARGLTIVRSESGFGGSDQQSFYGAGIPVLFFFTGLHSDYHRPGDTADKINYAGEAAVLDYVAEVAWRIADLPARPEYRRIAAPVQEGGPARLRASLGTIPDYSADVDGVMISGIRPGSAAERAGIRAGDILVRIGGRTIHSIQDFAMALGENKPGDTVEVAVRRGGRILTLQATLEAGRR
ncbi:MAG: M20/M25/M40 family metallo-hydrolase [Chthonomonadales bacterium]